MKIAVSYENGNIFQHFGKTEEFKVYEVEDGKVISSEILGSDGAGHEALASLLAQQDIGVLICGGIGDGAQNALAGVGITVYSGAQGSCDEAVETYLRGELVSKGTTCDHHDHDEEEGCGGCAGSCGGCSGGCGGGAPQVLPGMEGPNAGKTCRVHYKGTLNDGSVFDSSYDRGEPLEFICGVGMMIKGFDLAVVNMEVGEIVNVHIMPEDAYGERKEEMLIPVAIADLPGSENLEIGQQVYLTNGYGQQFLVKVIEKTETDITFDANHEMAGKELNFQIELVEVK